MTVKTLRTTYQGNFNNRSLNNLKKSHWIGGNQKGSNQAENTDQKLFAAYTV